VSDLQSEQMDPQVLERIAQTARWMRFPARLFVALAVALILGTLVVVATGAMGGTEKLVVAGGTAMGALMYGLPGFILWGQSKSLQVGAKGAGEQLTKAMRVERILWTLLAVLAAIGLFVQAVTLVAALALSGQ